MPGCRHRGGRRTGSATGHFGQRRRCASGALISLRRARLINSRRIRDQSAVSVLFCENDQSLLSRHVSVIYRYDKSKLRDHKIAHSDIPTRHGKQRTEYRGPIGAVSAVQHGCLIRIRVHERLGTSGPWRRPPTDLGSEIAFH